MLNSSGDDMHNLRIPPSHKEHPIPHHLLEKKKKILI